MTRDRDKPPTCKRCNASTSGVGETPGFRLLQNPDLCAYDSFVESTKHLNFNLDRVKVLSSGSLQYKTQDGGVLNWFPTTGRLMYQGQLVARERLENLCTGRICPACNETSTESLPVQSSGSSTASDSDLPALTPDQVDAVDRLKEFLTTTASSTSLFGLFGYAGTGKTFCIQRLFEKGHPYGRIAMTAPTHKATGVLRHMAAENKLTQIDFLTVHKLLGLRKVQENGREFYRADPKVAPPIYVYDVVIVDECSMMGTELWDLLIDAITVHPLHIIFMGDPAQLPPVGELDSKTFAVPHVTLHHVIRNKGVLQAAGTFVRENLAAHYPPVARDSTDEFGEICYLPYKEWYEQLLARGDKAKALAFTNEVVDKINRWIRTRLYGENPPPFIAGELVVVVESFEEQDTERDSNIIYTECELKVLAAHETTAHNLPCWELDVLDEDKQLLTFNTLSADQIPAYESSLHAALTLAKRASRKDWDYKSLWAKYFQLKNGFGRVRPRWATTVHKSQGSTYDYVFMAQTNVLKAYPDIRNRLLYVGYTRAKKGLYLC